SATILFAPVWGQITTSCTPAMIMAFAPCLNFVTNNSSNGVGPTAFCCNSLKSLMINGKDCVCLIAIGSIPFQIPVNRTLALSLPRACNVPGVPLRCKGGD
ncbi:PREDICTED: non-specific lipid-transfer protein-like protein At2g13820, partial [Erythranthe guttata]